MIQMEMVSQTPLTIVHKPTVILQSTKMGAQTQMEMDTAIQEMLSLMILANSAIMIMMDTETIQMVQIQMGALVKQEHPISTPMGVPTTTLMVDLN